MKAAIFKANGILEIAEVPTPVSGPGEALVKVAYCGICGSDVHLVDGGLLPPGAIIGHELSGTVAEIGKDQEGFREGDAVIVLPMDPCLKCRPCQEGNYQKCVQLFDRSYGLGKIPGAFSEYLLVKTSMLYPIPEGLDLKTAALTEPWAVARHGVEMLDLFAGAPVLILGAGPIGLFCIYALKAAGENEVFVSEPDPYRREKARLAGATIVDPGAGRLSSLIEKSAGRPPDFVMDCAGAKFSIQEAISAAGPAGQIVVLGMPMAPITLKTMSAFAKEVRLNFSFGYTPREFSESLDSLSRKAVDPAVVISDVMPLKEISTAFNLLHESGRLKIMIDVQNG